MTRDALVSSFCALLFTNILAGEGAEDIEGLTGRCSNGDRSACMELQTAVARLTDQTLLAQIAGKEGDRGVRVTAIVAMDGANPALRRLAGLRFTTDGLLSSIAVIKLAIQEPRIRERLPQIVFATSIAPVSRSYSPSGLAGGSLGFSISGESVSCVLSQGGKTLAKKNWETDFPLRATGAAFLAARVNGRDLLTELLHNVAFTQDDLAELSSSEIYEVRETAIRELTDKVTLAKVAVEAKDPSVRWVAVGKLTDQALVAKIAAEDKDAHVRNAAVGKLADQALLAKIAVDDKDAYVRSAAAWKVTDQALLAKIAAQDKDYNVRRAAVMRVTDQALLAKIAAQDKDAEVRQAAEQTLARIQNNAK